MSIDEKIWKCLVKQSLERKGTTYFDVKESKIEHPLKPCLGCSGYDTLCINYHNMQFYENLYQNFKRLR